jgi:hypothetical protein
MKKNRMKRIKMTTKRNFKIACLVFLVLTTIANLFSQITDRPRPAEWDQLVYGGRFLDRFLPMPPGVLSRDTWGAEGVILRYIDNGIENSEVSFWGGNILRDAAGKYHFFVCDFGQVASQEAVLQLTVEKNGEKINIGKATIPALKPYEKANVLLVSKPLFEKGTEYAVTSTILYKDKIIETYDFKIIVIP